MGICILQIDISYNPFPEVLLMMRTACLAVTRRVEVYLWKLAHQVTSNRANQSPLRRDDTNLMCWYR